MANECVRCESVQACYVAVYPHPHHVNAIVFVSNVVFPVPCWEQVEQNVYSF